LTEKGLSLTPTFVELAIWSDQNLREHNPIMRESDELELMKTSKAEFIERLKKGHRENWLE
ncbi:MAG: transcriptional regulator, partial [Bacteroidota bacterium]